MSEPVATQNAAVFTRWRCKSRGTPGYNGTPEYSVLHYIDNSLCGSMEKRDAAWYTKLLCLENPKKVLRFKWTIYRNVTSIICFNYQTQTCISYTITPISWRYSDLISRSFYNHFIFYIIYANVFIFDKLCCSAGATTCHQTRYIYMPGASSYYHIKLFKLNILV